MSMRVENKQPDKARDRLQKLTITIGVFSVCFVGLILFLFTPVLNPATYSSYPLGDKMEYIGQKHYGCWLFCDSNPGTVLYYATDMSKGDLKSYFRSAKDIRLEQSSSRIDGQVVEYTAITLKLSNGYLYMDYFNDPKLLKDLAYPSDVSSQFIRFDSLQYQQAKDSI